MTTWADIQKLAADLQRVQLTEGAKRLSEKNCVEVVSMLLNSKKIDLVFTIDGREYLTKKHLITEIKNECTVNGGRISLSVLSHALNVDYDHIENAVSSILKQSNSFELYNAELISREYVRTLLKDLNENLQNSGVLSVIQLAKTWDLPLEILNSLVLNEIGSKINAIRDDDKLYTVTYLKSQKNLLRAIMNALTRVTSISRVASYLNLSNSIFWRLYDELVAENEVPGITYGGRSSYHAYFVPTVYNLIVKSFIRKTFERENLLEVSTFKKLSIANPIGLLNEIFSPNEYSSLIFFSSVIISKNRWNEIYEDIQEEIRQHHFVDVNARLPPSFSTDEDVEKVTSMCIKENKEWKLVVGEHLIYEHQLLVKALRALDSFISEKAKQEAFLWERQSKLITKAERQRMESDWDFSKAKRVKSGKIRGGKQTVKEDPDSGTFPINIEPEEIEHNLKILGDFPSEILNEITEQIYDTVKVNLRTRIESILQNERTEFAKEQKRSYAKLQENIQDVYNQICIFENGASVFSDGESDRLLVHLCKTLCSEAANMVLAFVSGKEGSKNFSSKVKEENVKSIKNFEAREAVSNLFSSVENNSIGGFHSSMIRVSSLGACSLGLKMPDKKKRAELIEAYAEGLEKRLKDCEDPATGLLIALLLIFARKRSVAIHATGKFVSVLIREVSNIVDKNLTELLKCMESLVISSFKEKTNEETKSALTENLLDLKKLLVEPVVTSDNGL